MDTHRDHHPIRIGALLWPQQAQWAQISTAAALIESAGLDVLWTWDHLHAIVGDPLQPIFEGWTMLAALATQTERVELGLMVGANTFRNPGITCKSAVTLDHISAGRAWLGLGGAWFEYEHEAHGIDFGTGFGQRLDWLDEAAGAVSGLLAGKSLTSAAGNHYAFRDLEHHPLPFRGAGSLPLMIGGSGERKTLRTVARYAQGWNAGGSAEKLARKAAILERHCADVGRDALEIEYTKVGNVVLRDDQDRAERAMQDGLAANGSSRTPDPRVDFLGTEEQVADRWREYLDAGFTQLVVDLPSPYDHETIERLPRLRELVANT